jgi:hypothetical protein
VTAGVGCLCDANICKLVTCRLEMRLKKYGLCERKIKGDGNCQFRAVADQLYRDSKFHLDVRRIAVHQLRSNQSSYAQFVPTGASSIRPSSAVP